MWNGAAEALKPSPARIIASPATRSASWLRPCAAVACAISREAELAGRAVDERRAEEQDRRAEAADDEVLEPRLERADELDVDRAEDVEGDREPLEPEEERDQVVRRDEEGHARAGRRRAARSTRRRGRRVIGSAQETPTASRPAPAMIERRRVRRAGRARIASAITPLRRAALCAKRSAAATNAPTKPSRADDRARTHAAGRRAGGAPRRAGDARAAAEQRRATGESANQSIGGVLRASRAIIGTPARCSADSASRRRPKRVVGDRRRPGREDEQARRRAGRGCRARPAAGRAPRSVTALPSRSVEHGRDQPQHVHRREHDRDRADDRPAPAGREDAGQDEELARERASSRARRARSRRSSSARSRAPAGRAPSRRARRARRSPVAQLDRARRAGRARPRSARG